jgi:hypothetical protein
MLFENFLLLFHTKISYYSYISNALLIIIYERNTKQIKNKIIHEYSIKIK